MAVRLLLIPNTEIQPLWVTTFDVAEFGIIEGLAVEVSSAGEVVVRVDSVTEEMAVSEACDRRYGVLALNSHFACVELAFDPIPGETYEITVTAQDRPTASGTVTVPGPFEIGAVEASGSPPGTEGLEATWTRSDSAWAYLIGYSSSALECGSVNVKGCPAGWYVTTSDTALKTLVSAPSIQTSGGWTLDVFAVNRGLFDYLTTGSGDEFFPVPPLSNVNGGHGFLGAWVHRSYNLGR